MGTMQGVKSVPTIDTFKVNLLIADDHVDTLELLRTKVRLLGWTGTFVTNASAIIEAMNTCSTQGNCFDAIIADVNYFDNQPGPRLTGITAAREIRKVRSDIPIIFITAFVNSIMREEIRRVHAELVPKPFDIDQLFARVKELVYWQRTAQVPYNGEERRKRSVNFTSNKRRATDHINGPSPRIRELLTDLRKEMR
jgi:CheY-like chemotaxis protein